MIKEILPIAEILAGLAAAMSLWYAARAFHQQSRSLDLQTLASLSNDMQRAEERLANSKSDPEAFGQAFVHYANWLEVMATSLNNGLMNPVTARLARNRLIEDLAIFQSQPGAIKLLESSLDAPATFSDLREFIRRNRKDFDAAVERRRVRH